MKKQIIHLAQNSATWLQQHKIKASLLFLIGMFYYFSLPSKLFSTPYATVIESKEGELLGAKIASDGQWRFPAADSVPYKFKKCLVYFEDEYFYYHPGFNPVAMYAAIKQNKKANKVVRGGSTLTQQVIRLARNQKKRTYFEKAIELILATRLELKFSKNKILELHAAHAPFGGNVVGLEMASWRYFGLKSHQLSWAESATLAILPNAPSLIYPGKNQEKLRAKRNTLLLKLKNNKVIDLQTYKLAILEPLPQKPFDLPKIAPHLLQNIAKNNLGSRIKTTVSIGLQNRVNQIAAYYYKQYKQNEVHNVAILVVDVANRNVLSYVGNAPTDKNHQKDVDVIVAPRSTGSILKPLLYAAMLDDGELLPNTLVPDIPTQISGYTPQNFDLTFDGAVPAHRALARSLNIPAVLLLQDFGVNKFYEKLQQLELNDISKPPDHYGLSLILGGAESNLWDLCKTYAAMSSTLNFFNKNDGNYRANEFCDLNVEQNKSVDFGDVKDEKNSFGAGAIWLTYNAMQQVNRPEGDEAWQFYDSSLKIAWKTGTSFGNRDAWAIGTNAGYVVGVWVGNATGEGRPALTGVSSAAPILFDVFNLLPRKNWFATPNKDLRTATVCNQSGYLSQSDCPSQKQLVPTLGLATKQCPYHQKIHLDASGKYQVNSSCEPTDKIITKSWFVLPPVIAWYYKSKHTDYVALPPFREDCLNASNTFMDFIYPKNKHKIYLTKNFDSKIQPVIIKVAHSQANSALFWYLDAVFIGSTKTFHEMPIITSNGHHTITVVDTFGNEIKRKIEIVQE